MSIVGFSCGRISAGNKMTCRALVEIGFPAIDCAFVGMESGGYWIVHGTPTIDDKIQFELAEPLNRRSWRRDDARISDAVIAGHEVHAFMPVRAEHIRRQSVSRYEHGWAEVLPQPVMLTRIMARLLHWNIPLHVFSYEGFILDPATELDFMADHAGIPRREWDVSWVRDENAKYCAS